MGLRDVLTGRHQLSKPAPDRLFALSTAYVTLESEHSIKSSGVAGIVYMGYFGSVQADAASGSELISVVTAVVLGGVDIFGGAGSMLGVFLALILIAVLRNGMQLANVGGAHTHPSLKVPMKYKRDKETIIG